MKQQRLIAALFLVCVFPSATFAFMPEPQSIRVVPGSVSPPIHTFRIYAEQSDSTYWFTAGLCQKWLVDFPGVLQPTHDLSTLGQHGTNEIILGNPIRHPEVAQIAAEHHMSTIDLGLEGYLMHSERDSSGQGPWRIIIIANTPAGIRFGLATLLQAIDSTSYMVPEAIIRDSPDRPVRAYQYNLGKITTPGDAWASAHIENIDQIAKFGVNQIHLLYPYWFSMGLMVEGQDRWSWLKQIFDHCRLLGIEPVPELSNHLRTSEPSDPEGENPLGEQHPLWREGKYLDGERYWAFENEALENVVGPFDNDGQGLSWTQGCGANGLPLGWHQYVETGAAPWVFSGPGTTCPLPNDPKALSVTGSPSGRSIVSTEVTIIPEDYYILKVTFSEVMTLSGRPLIVIQDPASWDTWHSAYAVDTSSVEATYELPFSVPDSLLSTGNLVQVAISTNHADVQSIVVKSVSIERRSGNLTNLMIDVANDLDVKITSLDGQTTYAGHVDYDIMHDPYSPSAYHWSMRSDGPRYWIQWKTAAPAEPVRVYATLGVPNPDPVSNGKMTTWCLNSPGLRAEYDRVLNEFFDHGLGPKFIGVDLDEIRGMNRCGRCIERGLTNSEYLTEFIKHLQGTLALRQDAGKYAVLTAWGDMFNPNQNGTDDYNHAQWLGQPGPTAWTSDPQFLSNLQLYLWHHGYSLAWRTEGQGMTTPQVKVLGCLYSETPLHTGDPILLEQPADWAKDATWYEPDAQGFFAYNFDKARLPLEREKTMFDYAWKRYANPDATLQAFGPGNQYLGDDVAAHTVSIDKGQTLTVYPFGRAESRDGCSGNVTALLDWGDGSTASATTVLNGGSLSHVYPDAGPRTITLTVTVDEDCNGATPSPKSVAIQVQVTGLGSGGCKKNCPEEGSAEEVAVPLVTGIRAVAPNPFLQTATVHYATEERSSPLIRVYDVVGRLVRSEDLGEHAAGVWQWTWDGLANDGREARAGLYFIRLQVGQKIAVGRIVKQSR